MIGGAEAVQIMSSVVVTLGTIIVAVITTRTRKDARAARQQVENNHDTNLREELDDRHAETRRWWRGISRDIGGLRSELRAMDHRIQRLEDIELEHKRGNAHG